MTRRRGRHSYKFTEQTHSIRGVVAIIIAIGSIGSCILMIANSYKSAGNANIYIGSYGILAFLAAIVSIFIAISSVREQETFRAIPYTAMIMSVIATAIWLAIYVGGML